MSYFVSFLALTVLVVQDNAIRALKTLAFGPRAGGSMIGPEAARVLVVDDDPRSIADLSRLLTPSPAPEPGFGEDWIELEVLGAATDHERFPRFDITIVRSGPEGLEAVRRSLEEGSPYGVVVLAVAGPERPDALDSAEQIRALDPDLPMILAGTRCPGPPLEVAERLAPADRLFFLRKPFHAAETQHLVLALASRSQAERGRRPTAWPGAWTPARRWEGLWEALDGLAVGLVVFDRRGRLVSVTPAMAAMAPELGDLLVPGTRWGDFLAGLDRLASGTAPPGEDAWPDGWDIPPPARGGLRELALPGPRWLLLAQGTTCAGEGYGLFLDVTALKGRDAPRARAAHRAHMAKALGVLADRVERALAQGPRAAPAARVRTRDSKVTVLSGGPVRQDAEARLYALAERLRALGPRPERPLRTVRLDRLVFEAVQGLRGELPEDIDVEVVAGPGLWPVRLDPAGLEPALRELARNAREAMPGGGRLTFETCNTRLDGDRLAWAGDRAGRDWVRLSVQDTGVGLDEDLAGRALEPFVTTTSDAGEHLGLGLSLVDAFARCAGGRVEIDGASARGATISLYFPRAETQAAGTRVARASEQARLQAAADGRPSPAR